MQSGTRHLRARLQGAAERWVRAGAGDGLARVLPCPRRAEGGSGSGRAAPGRGGGVVAGRARGRRLSLRALAGTCEGRCLGSASPAGRAALAPGW